MSLTRLLTEEVSEPLQRTGYVDEAGALLCPGHKDAPKRYNDSAQGIQAVRQGEIDTLLVLTADYLESGAVEQYGTSREGGRFSGNPAAESAFSDFLKVELIIGRVEADVLARVSGPGNYQSLHVSADETITEAITAYQRLERASVPVMLALLLPVAAMIGAGAMGRSFTEDNETRMFEMLVTSAPVFSVMAGKPAALVATGLGPHSGVDHGGSLCPGVFPLHRPGAVSWHSCVFAGAGPTTNEHIGLVRRAARA